MNTESNAVPESFDSQPIAPAAISPTQPFYWSVRRELWENRSIYIAPLAVAAVFLFSFLISAIHLPSKMRAALALDPMQQQELIGKPYNFVALSIMATAIIVGVFTLSTRCTANVAIAPFCSGSLCRFPISRPCSRRRASR